MKTKTNRTSFWWILQGLLLLVGLVSVVYLIRHLRSPEGKINLDEIFEDRQVVWDWCPAGEDVKFEAIAAISLSGVGRADICEVMTQAVRTEQTEEANWEPLIRAKALQKNEEVTLEGDLDRGIFRVQGLPFYSPMLQEYLKALSSP